LVTNFLDSGSQCFDLLLLLRELCMKLFLLLCDGRLEFGNCALLFCDLLVLLEELVEQQRLPHRSARFRFALSIRAGRVGSDLSGSRSELLASINANAKHCCPL